MDIAEFTEILSSIASREVSVGYSTIKIYSRAELLEGQVGYSVDPNGKSLSGIGKGDWSSNWIVIGQDETCGDPIFIDLSATGFPVFTAMHGMGDWDPVAIADSFDDFNKSLKIVSDIAVGREYPVLLEKNPISSQDRKKALDAIRQLNPNSDIEFWELILRPT